MKYLFLITLSVIFLSCSRVHEDNPEFDLAEWNSHVESTSELMIFIPDIQIYTDEEDKTRYLNAIIDRILTLHDNGVKIKAVLQAGDITNRNTTREWASADRLFSRLDNKIPYIMCPGNHDYGRYTGDSGNANNRNTPYSSYFDYSTNSAFVTSFEDNIYDNSLFRIFIHGNPFQVISLEFAPADDVIAWADSIASADEDETAIVLTHAYMYKDGVRFNYSEYGSSQDGSPYNYSIASYESINDGEEIWQKLVYPNRSVRFVLCGHMAFPDYVGNLISANSFGDPVLQMLFDTQSFPNGGNGMIQIMEFRSDMRTVMIHTYSTITGSWTPGIKQEYLFDYSRQ